MNNEDTSAALSAGGTPVNELPIHDLKINPLEKNMSKLVLVTEGDKPNIDLGISEVKKIVKAIKELEEAYVIVTKDGVVTLGDFTSHPVEVLWQPAMAILDVIKTKDLLIHQILRIDTNEADELIQTVCDEFQISSDSMKVKIANIVKAAYHIGEIFK